MVDTKWIEGPIYSIRSLMSESSTFQTEVEADDAEGALDSIHVFQTYNEDYDDDNTEQAIPRVRLSYLQVGTSKQGTTNWSAFYSVKADFEFARSNDNDQLAARAMVTKVQNIVNEMQAVYLSGAGGIEIHDLDASPCVNFSDPDETPEGQEYIWYSVIFSKGIE